MPNATMTPSAPIQGVASPDVFVDPNGFYAATRRMRFVAKGLGAAAGLGAVDVVQLRQTGIIDSIEIRVKGTFTFGGTITGTTMSYEWPLNLLPQIQLSANGQSNLISARSVTLRALEFARDQDLHDIGAPATFGATAVTAGSLKVPTDDWGTSGGNSLNPGATVAANGAYTFDLTFVVPVAMDPVSLIGAIYAQSSATNLTLSLQWATQAQLLTLGGSATFALTSLQWQATTRAYSIPNVGGKFLVPDLSQFHQVAEYRQAGLGSGMTTALLPGTGVGRRLLRLMWNAYSGTPPVPLAMTETNYGQVDWAYGGSDTPEQYPNGTQLRAENFRLCGTDLGGQWGFGLWDFANQFALRDSIDEAATADLRLEFTLQAAPTAGFAQIMQETLFAAPVGA
jgi:hypothetical protein